MGTQGDAHPLGFLLFVLFFLQSGSTQGSKSSPENCTNSVNCPLNATCVNSTHCTCRDGFLSIGNRFFTNVTTVCNEINECVGPNRPDCGPYAKCISVFWGYFCICIDGYTPSSGQPRFMTTSENDCHDINECRQPRNPCGRNATCINTPGSYKCICLPGFISANNTPPCNVSSFNCSAELEKVRELHKTFSRQGQPSSSSSSFSSFLNSTFEILNSRCGGRSVASSLEEVTRPFNSLLNSTPTWVDESKNKVVSAVDILLQSVEIVALATAYRNPEMTQTMTTESMAIETRLVTQDCSGNSEVFRLHAYNETMEIHCGTVTEVASQAGVGAAAVFISYSALDSIINATLLNTGNIPAGGKLGNSRLNSRVGIKSEEEAHCMYWKFEAGKDNWSPNGCIVLDTNSTHTTCSCNHLSSFAVLMAPKEVLESYLLQVLTYLGLTLSMLCLFLAILTFLLCRSIHNVSTSIYLQLCLCLFLADLLFLTAVDRTSNQVACAVIAGFLHYLFLACFTWMLLEGLHLFLTIRNLQVVNYTSANRFKKRYMYPFGYGFPALIVAISAAVKPDGYGSRHYCWLSLEAGFRWSFLGPVCAIILINITFFALTLWILTSKLSTLNTNVSTLRDHRLLTFKAIAQIFILGCTWILGLLQVGPVATVMAYLFTIVNSLQGAFIFLVHCLLNHQVRGEYQRWIKGVRISSTIPQAYDLFTSTGQTTGTKMGSSYEREAEIPHG